MLKDNSNNLPDLLRGCDKDSFAAYTLANRLPHIIDDIVLENTLSLGSIENLKNLKQEIETGVIVELEEKNWVDGEQWRKICEPFIDKDWYSVPFLFAEMYFYRRILEAINDCNVGSETIVDPFKAKKESSLLAAKTKIQQHAKALNDSFDSHDYTIESLRQYFLETIWANQNDLSQIPDGNYLPHLHKIGGSLEFILVDQLQIVLDYFAKPQKRRKIDIIVDNSGLELLADLALVCYLLESNYAVNIVVHCKQHPIFVSDATQNDVAFTFGLLENSASPPVSRWGGALKQFVNEKRLLIKSNAFWGMPIPFSAMPQDIRSMFQSSDLIILKGDVNYRRLTDDRHWPHNTPLQQFSANLPSKGLLLRILKSEVLVGFDAEQYQGHSLTGRWLTEGKYGVIQCL